MHTAILRLSLGLSGICSLLLARILLPILGSLFSWMGSAPVLGWVRRSLFGGVGDICGCIRLSSVSCILFTRLLLFLAR